MRQLDSAGVQDQKTVEQLAVLPRDHVVLIYELTRHKIYWLLLGVLEPTFCLDRIDDSIESMFRHL